MHVIWLLHFKHAHSTGETWLNPGPNVGMENYCVQEIPPPEIPENGAAAAASGSQGKEEETEAFLRSKDVTCGICMDKVYEKTDIKSHVFGILPNCNHPFCLQCIMTWRKTKDLGLDVIK